MNRYQKFYKEIICQDLLVKNNYTNIFELPKLEKIVINTTSKRYIQDRKIILPTLLALELIVGQKSKITYAKKSLASFKLRKGQLLGCKLTLRKKKMYQFLDILNTVVLPKFRDFSGISKKSINTSGNLAFGIDNLIVFPELENHFEFFQTLKGLTINIILKKKLKNDQNIYTAFQLPKKHD